MYPSKVIALSEDAPWCRGCGLARGQCRGGTGCGTFSDDIDPMVLKFEGVTVYRYANGIVIRYGSGLRQTRVLPSFGGGGSWRRLPIVRGPSFPFPELDQVPEARPQKTPRSQAPPVDFVGAGSMHRRWR